ncbi:uncharacterized protein N7511_006674, partial [Penicillium nucicola]|uniref:uncharacterized protein n=1 Tax=Penicillium nucicola TaxID=1850975 RepID=UPI00254582A6
IAETLCKSNVNATHVFFFAYIQPQSREGGGIWSTAEMVKVNKALLANFLGALAMNKIIPQIVVLRLGAKYCGLHLGQTANSQVESLPRFSKEHGSGRITTRPSYIVGTATTPVINLCLSLGIYASFQKYLLKSFPFTWSLFWPMLADHYGIPWNGSATDPNTQWREINTQQNPLPRGYGDPETLRFAFSLTEWAKQAEIQEAWKEIEATYGVNWSGIDDVEKVFGFTDFALITPYPSNFSRDKAQTLGFFGYVDTCESILRVLDDFVDMNILPIIA